jgi:hypothetical protein
MIDPSKLREALNLIVAQQTPLLRQGEDYIWRPAKACVDAAQEVLVLLDAPIEGPLVTDGKIRAIVDSLEDAGLSGFIYVGKRVREIYEADRRGLYDLLQQGANALSGEDHNFQCDKTVAHADGGVAYYDDNEECTCGKDVFLSACEKIGIKP